MSDSKFEYIDDVLLNVDKDKIEKKKTLDKNKSNKETLL